MAHIAAGHPPQVVAYVLADVHPGNCAGWSAAPHPAVVVVLADVDSTPTRTPTCRAHLSMRLRRIEAAGGRNVEVRGPAAVGDA